MTGFKPLTSSVVSNCSDDNWATTPFCPKIYYFLILEPRILGKSNYCQQVGSQIAGILFDWFEFISFNTNK